MYRDSPRVSEEDVPLRTSSKRSTPLHRVSVDEEASRAAATKDPTSIERKGAIRKKHPEKGKLQKTPRHSITVEWPEPAARSSDISANRHESQTTHFEFPSEKDALEAAIKAHFAELRELDSSEQKHSSLDTDKHNLQSTLGLEPEVLQHPFEPDGNNEYTISWGGEKPTTHTSSANSASTTPRQFYAPMRVPSAITGESFLTRSQSPENHVAT
jgi:hypothetical protein